MNSIVITSNNIEIQNPTTLNSDSSTDECFATDLSTKYVKNVDLQSPIENFKPTKSRSSKSGNKKSFVWKYFSHPKILNGDEDRTRTECLECKSQLAFNASGTTTTMLNHLKSRHPNIAECEEWRKLKIDNIGRSENFLSISKNCDLSSQTLSGSFDFQKNICSSPDSKNSDVNSTLFPVENNLYNNYMDQEQLMCLSKMYSNQLMLPSCLTTTKVKSDPTINNGNISTIRGETIPNGLCTLDSNNNFTENQLAPKRKRKRPSCKPISIYGNDGECFNKFEKIVNQNLVSDISPIHSINSFNHTNASIASMLNHNVLSIAPSHSVYYNNSNNSGAFNSPLQVLKSFSTFAVPTSPLESKMGVTEVEKVIVYWLIKDLRPYSVLEEFGMKNLFSSLMPSVAVPSISNLKNQILPSIYWILRNEILNDFSADSGAALSIELWDNSKNNCIYASLKLNFFSSTDFQLRSKMIATKEINDKYLCSDLLLNCCNEIGADLTKLQFLPVVMNNPEFMNDELANVGEIEQNKKIIIIPCLINSLQEVAKIGFEQSEVIDLLEKCRALKELAGAFNLPFDNSVSGNNAFLSSTLCSGDKFELIYWVYRNLDQIVDMIDCFNPERFSKDDEKFLRELTPLLEHIYQTLSVIEQNKLFFSASMIKSIILTMNKSPFQPKDDDHVGVTQFKTAVKNRLSKIYPDNGRLHDILTLATVLDPRFKKCQDFDELIVLQELKEEISNNNETQSSTFSHKILQSIKREDLSTIFGDDCFSQEPNSEVDKYLNEHKIDIEKSPIKWWHDNESRFPHLYKLALKYLCIPLANQYGVGSLSGSDSIICSRRKELDPEEIDRYLFLNYNWT